MFSSNAGLISNSSLMRCSRLFVVVTVFEAFFEINVDVA